MRSTISKYGQTVIPAELRRRYNIQVGDTLEWLDDGKTIRVVPLPADPIAALRGRGKGERLTERLLTTRAQERHR